MKITGGAKLEATLRKLSESVSNASTLRVGFLEGATEADGTPVASVAFWNEFGTSKIPPRPFFRNMIAAESPHWGDDTGKALKHYDFDAASALDAMGQKIAGELAQSIIDTNTPPLSPTTIKRKGFDKALVDTGTMLRTASKGYDVR